MKRLMVLLTALMAISFMVTAADDAAGNWKATVDTPNGPMALTFQLKTEAGKVTGTMGSEMMGSVPIAEGKMDGDKISFTVNGQMGAIHAVGTVSGDTLKLTLTVGDGQFTFDVNAARVKPS
jgi:hypothetical protein